MRRLGAELLRPLKRIVILVKSPRLPVSKLLKKLKNWRRLRSKQTCKLRNHYHCVLKI
jgi:hypothetical protein